jgi:choline-sulfatase
MRRWWPPPRQVEIHHCELDPPQLVRSRRRPALELNNLAMTRHHADAAGLQLGGGRRALGHGRFDAEVRQSQARRWVVYEALRNGGYYPWDYQPLQKASERYMRNHMDLNCTSLEFYRDKNCGRSSHGHV